MIIEANARPVVIEAPVPLQDNANLIPVDEQSFREFSLLTGGDDPRLDITGYVPGVDMIITTPENFVAEAKGTPANFGDAVNEWVQHDNLSLTLDTPQEVDACAQAIKTDQLNDMALESGTDKVLGRLVVPKGVCYDGIPGVGANPETIVVQATAQVVYQEQQQEIVTNKEKAGFIKGILAILGLAGTAFALLKTHRAINRLLLGYGPSVSVPNTAREKPQESSIEIIHSSAEIKTRIEKYAAQLGAQNVKYTANGGIAVRYPVPAKQVSADGSIEWKNEPVWIDVAEPSKDLQEAAKRPSIPHPMIETPVLKTKKQIGVVKTEYEKNHPGEIVVIGVNHIGVIDPQTNTTKVIAYFKLADPNAKGAPTQLPPTQPKQIEQAPTSPRHRRSAFSDPLFVQKDDKSDD